MQQIKYKTNCNKNFYLRDHVDLVRQMPWLTLENKVVEDFKLSLMNKFSHFTYCNFVLLPFLLSLLLTILAWGSTSMFWSSLRENLSRKPTKENRQSEILQGSQSMSKNKCLSTFVGEFCCNCVVHLFLMGGVFSPK